MFSIVIPVFNKQNYIVETVNSVLNQIYINFELILVNDGSTDNSLREIQKIDDKRIKIIDIPNSGVSVARNTGIKKAKFKYIAFLDADDWWGDTFLEEIVGLIKKHPMRKVFATGRCRVFKKKTDLYQNEFLPTIDKIGLVDYIKVISKYLPPINSSNVVINKEELISVGLFKVNQKQHEDHDLWLRICKYNEVVFVNKNLSFYRKEIINSASLKYYEANDFVVYLNTIKEVKNKISKSRNIYFKRYYTKFILLTYIKNYGNYTEHQTKLVSKKINEIVNFPYSVIITVLNIFPYKGIYDLIKNIKSNG